MAHNSYLAQLRKKAHGDLNNWEDLQDVVEDKVDEVTGTVKETTEKARKDAREVSDLTKTNMLLLEGVLEKSDLLMDEADEMIKTYTFAGYLLGIWAGLSALGSALRSSKELRSPPQ